MSGKRVGVIGSAASAVQLIPEVAKVARHLTVFQRSPNWLLPRLDREVSETERKLLAKSPEVGASEREHLYLTFDTLFWQIFSHTEEGRAFYTEQSLALMAMQVPDAAMRRKLTPNYPIGCKRVLFADDYYPALTQPNVALVTERIDRIVPPGVVTKDGVTHELDVLVYATGFETTGWHWSVDVTGKGGFRLADEWKHGPEAYLGITVAKFPNLFMIYGPNTNLGHNTITFMIERQIGIYRQCLDAMRTRELGRDRSDAGRTGSLQRGAAGAPGQIDVGRSQLHQLVQDRRRPHHAKLGRRHTRVSACDRSSGVGRLRGASHGLIWGTVRKFPAKMGMRAKVGASASLYAAPIASCSAQDGNSFRFTEGQYRIDVFVHLLGDRKRTLLFSQQIEISREIAAQLAEPGNGLYFDWGPDASRYLPHVEKSPPLPDPMEVLELLGIPHRLRQSPSKLT